MTKKLKINCPSCGKVLRGATSDMIGDIGVCPVCKAEFEIPGGDGTKPELVSREPITEGDTLREKQSELTYKVAFGSASALDQFGFVRNGEIKIQGDQITYFGNKRWSILAQIIILLLILVGLPALFGYALGFLSILLVLVIMDYFCTSAGTLSIPRQSVTDVKRKGRQIRFKASHPKSGKIKKTVFKVDTEENAMSLENVLKNRHDILRAKP